MRPVIRFAKQQAKIVRIGITRTSECIGGREHWFMLCDVFILALKVWPPVSVGQARYMVLLSPCELSTNASEASAGHNDLQLCAQGHYNKKETRPKPV